MGYIIADKINHTMVAVTSKNMTYPVGNLLEIIQVKVSSHDDNQSYDLTLVESTPTSILRTFNIDFTEFNNSQESALNVLSKNGYIVPFNYVNFYRVHFAFELQQWINSNQVEYYHSNLGFTTMKNGTKTFLLGDTQYLGKVSTYIDTSFKFQKGSIKDYQTFLDNQVLPFFETRLALTLGLASIVSSDLKDYADVGTIVLNLIGQSSTGKTTAAQLLASLWGCPLVSNRGTVRTFNSTQNSLIHTFAGTNGVPIVIDDATSLGDKDLSSFIYNISAGEDKLRMTSDIQLRDSKGKWSGLIAITSESSILEQSTKTGGSIPRLLEFDNVKWTKSASHAKAIKRGIQSCYGHLGPAFLAHYLQLSLKEKHDLYSQCEDEIDSLVTQRDQYTGRIISKLAILYMTAKLVESFFSYKLYDSKEVRDYLVSYENDKVPVRSIEAQALEVIKNYIITNQHLFAMKHNKDQMVELATNRTFIGYKQFHDQNEVEFVVMSSNLKNELSKNGFHQWSNILRHLESLPFVKKYGKGNKVSETDNYIHVKAITFMFQRSEQDILKWYYQKKSPYVNGNVPVSDFKVDDSEAIEAIFKQ